MTKAIVLNDQALSWEDHDIPREVSGGLVAIEVAWAGVNRADLAQRAGNYPAPPGASKILGLEVSGYVSEVGPDVTHVKPGDAVCALLTGGGYATHVVVPAEQVLPIPDGLSLQQGAAIPEVFATAWLNLYNEAALEPGERVLLHAAAGGLGTAVIQLATSLGNPVFATAGSDEKLAVCRELGASGTWNRHNGSFVDAVRKWGGVDMVLDPVGGDYLLDDQKVLNAEGRITQIGVMGGRFAKIDLALLLVKRQRLIGSTLRSQSLAVKGKVMKALYDRVWPLLSAGQIVPLIDRCWPIEQAEQAMAYVEEDKNTGKVLLEVTD